MVKCEVIKEFSLKDFDSLKNLTRKNKEKSKYGKLYEGDVFECNENMAMYLSGGNDYNEVVVKPIEVEPVKEEEIVIIDELVEEQPKKPNKKKSKK